MSARKLDTSEARQLSQSSDMWPGTFNLKLIAQAVNNRRDLVELDGIEFSIKYDSNARAICVKPVNGNSSPCWWFSNEEMKNIIELEVFSE